MDGIFFKQEFFLGLYSDVNSLCVQVVAIVALLGAHTIGPYPFKQHSRRVSMHVFAQAELSIPMAGATMGKKHVFMSTDLAPS